MSKLRALPGVESVTVMEERLGSGWSDNSDMMVDGRLPDVANGASRTVRSNVVGPDFFRTLGVPVLAGRDFADSDTATSPHVGIINEQFAKRFFPNQNPLGHTIGTEDGRYQMTIVGVVKDHKYRSIDEEPIPMAWYMYAQIPMTGAMHVEMRVHGEPLAILPSARKALQQIESEPAADPADDPTRAIRHDDFAADAVCAACRVLRLPGGGSGGDGPLWNAGVSREHADGGDWRAHGCGRAAWAGGVDDPEGQLAADNGGRSDGRSAGDAGGSRVGFILVWREAARCGELFSGGHGSGRGCTGGECGACRTRGECRPNESATHGIRTADLDREPFGLNRTLYRPPG